jgi:hypothetical protein
VCSSRMHSRSARLADDVEGPGISIYRCRAGSRGCDDRAVQARSALTSITAVSSAVSAVSIHTNDKRQLLETDENHEKLTSSNYLEPSHHR